MTKRDETHEKLMRDLATLKLARIAEIYQEVLDEAARKNSSMLEVLSTLIAEEAIARSERALQRRIRHARLPKRKTLEEYDFIFPKRMPKQKILRLFDCQFIEQHLACNSQVICAQQIDLVDDEPARFVGQLSREVGQLLLYCQHLSGWLDVGIDRCDIDEVQ